MPAVMQEIRLRVFSGAVASRGAEVVRTERDQPPAQEAAEGP